MVVEQSDAKREFNVEDAGLDLLVQLGCERGGCEASPLDIDILPNQSAPDRLG
jgi:hypothetical protein